MCECVARVVPPTSRTGPTPWSGCLALAWVCACGDARERVQVCQDWGGLVGLRLVAEHSDRFRRVVVANTGLPIGYHAMPDAFVKWREFSQRVEELPVGMILQVRCVRADVRARLPLRMVGKGVCSWLQGAWLCMRVWGPPREGTGMTGTLLEHWWAPLPLPPPPHPPSPCAPCTPCTPCTMRYRPWRHFPGWLPRVLRPPT